MFMFLISCVVGSQIAPSQVSDIEASPIISSQTAVETYSNGYPQESVFEEEDTQEEFSCERGIAHWNTCFDMQLSTDVTCNDEELSELALVQSLSCTELYYSMTQLPLCHTLGINCEEDYLGCAAGPIHADDYRELLALSDSGSVQGIVDVGQRIARIREIFASYGDLRGAFASVYSPITNRAIASVQDEIYENNDWASDLIEYFAGRYFDNLRAALLGMETTQSWDRYYELSQVCSASPLRVAAHGIMVHLVVDLPHTLVDIETKEWMREDYDVFGLELLAVTDQIVDNLKNDYEIDAAPFFRGFFLGEWIDSIAGTGATTMFAFQSIRSKAWNNGLWLQDWRAGVAESEIYASWRSADGFLAIWDIMQ